MPYAKVPRLLTDPQPRHGKGAERAPLSLGPGGVEQTEEFTSEACRELLAYWTQTCDGNAMPRLQDFSLIDIYHLAPRITIKDVEEDGLSFRHRYWGTELTYAFGFDGTGMTHDDFIDPAHLDVARRVNRLAMEGGRPIRFKGHALAVGTDAVSVEIICLPLSCAERKRPDHVVSFFDFEL